MANKLMCHVVAGYPTADECLKLTLGMDRLGVGSIEVQIPFSDPIADGETIMRANDRALANGTNTEDSFRLIKQAKAKGVAADIYVMSYVQKLVHMGIEDFCSAATKAGARGLIIPDLPFDSPEHAALIKAAGKSSLQLVPVVSPGISDQRLKGALKGAGELIYITSMKGITGNRLKVTDELGKLCQSVRKISPGATIAVGFGVQNPKDVREITSIADTAVVGSSVIRKIDRSGTKAALDFIRSLTA